jgi:putative ABC transport system ATP-binding protein
MLGQMFTKTASAALPGESLPEREGQLIELRQVMKSYKTAVGDFTALRGVDLSVGAGEFVSVIGKSGSGKSTLINMLTGIDRPTSGEVWVADTAVHKLKEGQIAQWRGRTIGIVFQFFQLLPTLTLVENIMLPMDFCHMYTRRERTERAMYLLELVDLVEHAHKLPTAVSGGQQQRAAIARALANDPPIVVADEPTGNLDSRTAAAIFELFQNLVSQGKTIVMVTHDEAQARRASRTVIIADGEIVNEYLAMAMPSLSQQLLIEATRKLEPITFTPGEVILTQDDQPDKFYIVQSGEVHVYLRQQDANDVLVDTLGAGQYFGEIALLHGGVRTATVRASRKSGAEVVALNRADFEVLLNESVSTRSELDRVVDERRAMQERITADLNGDSDEE